MPQAAGARIELLYLSEKSSCSTPRAASTSASVPSRHEFVGDAVDETHGASELVPFQAVPDAHPRLAREGQGAAHGPGDRRGPEAHDRFLGIATALIQLLYVSPNLFVHFGSEGPNPREGATGRSERSDESEGGTKGRKKEATGAGRKVRKGQKKGKGRKESRKDGRRKEEESGWDEKG